MFLPHLNRVQLYDILWICMSMLCRLANCSPLSMIPIPEHSTSEGPVVLRGMKMAASELRKILVKFKTGQDWKDAKKKWLF